jgi:hypothetical protein
VNQAALFRSPFGLRDVLAAAWIAVVLLAYLDQFSAYVGPILALLR